MTKAVTILGVDPGSSRCGYGLIEKKEGKITLLEAGLLEIQESDPNQKLFYLARDFKKLLKKLRPDLAAVEKIYFSKNVKTAIEVAQARGVLVLEILRQQIPFTEFNSQQIKQSVTNYGLADKRAVARMVAVLLQVPPLKVLDDVTDALAVALAAASLAESRRANYHRVDNF